MTPSSRQGRLVVLCGGPGGEHEVSLRSGTSVLHAARTAFDVVPVVWTRRGAVLVGDAADRALAEGSTDEVEPAVEWTNLASAFAYLHVDAHDVVFPALHGPMGEDGAVQGFLDVVGVPYVGSGLLASALGMDKVAAKRAFSQAGLPVLEWRAVNATWWREQPDEVVRNLEGTAYPAFVKPANMGSSVGITRVAEPSGWKHAFDAAFRHDSVAVIERGLVGHREIEVAVWGGRDPSASVPGEIVVGGDGFYDYDKKYTDGAVGLSIPAVLDEDDRRRAMDLALQAHHAIGAYGLSRVDLFLDAAGRWWVNEINTMPGFTTTSMFPKLVDAMGTPFPDLIGTLVHLARRRPHRGAA